MKPITKYRLDIDWHCVCGDAEASHRSRPESEECWGHCQKMARDCAGQGYRPIDHAGRTPAISAIFERAMLSELPEAYTCDLSTDYQSLLHYTGSFIWVARTSGTELYLLEPEAEGGREWLRGYVKSALGWHKDNHPEALVFYWSAAKAELAPVSYDTALVIAATYLAPRQEVAV